MKFREAEASKLCFARVIEIEIESLIIIVIIQRACARETRGALACAPVPAPVRARALARGPPEARLLAPPCAPVRALVRAPVEVG